MVGFSRFKLLIGIFIPFLAIFLMSQNTFAATANVTSANVDFWSSSSQSGQVQASVSLPWSANIGGSSSNRQSFYLNNISMTYPISASASDLSVYGRLVMRFEPSFSSGEDAYFCNVHLNNITSSISSVQTSCNATVTYNYSDNTTYSVTLPIFFNYSLPSGALAAYVDYNQSLPNVALSNISVIFSKTGNYDIYSVSNGYSLVLTTLVSDGSYYITDSGGNVDLSPLVNQNQTIINQNQQIIDNQNQNTQDIIKSNQRCRNSRNLLQSISWQTNNVTKTENGNIIKLSANSGTLARAVFGLPSLEQGKIYTLSFYSKGVSTAGSFTYARIREYSNSGNWLTPQSTIPVSSDFVRVSVTFAANNVSSPFAWLYLSSSNNNTNNIEIYVKDFQLEEGSSATEYIAYGEEICKNINEEYYDEQRQADQNISNQNSSDIQGAENQQTTNLIGVLSNFVTQLTNFQATTCELTLPFPSFVGGNQVVNICQGKDVLGNFITVIGTLIMITFYIPLVISILKMIYNEIRSFTNG